MRTLSFLVRCLLPSVLLSLPLAPSYIPFQPVGDLVRSARMISVRARVPLSPLRQACDAVEEHLAQANASAPSDWLHVHLADMRFHCLALHGLDLTPRRPRRQLALFSVAVSSALGAIGLESLFHPSHREDLQLHSKEIHLLSDQMDRLVNLTSSLAQDYNTLVLQRERELSRQIILDEVRSVSSHLSRVLDGIVALLGGTVTPGLVSLSAMSSLWTNLSSMANHHQWVFPFDSFLNLYELPASFLVTNDVVHLTLGVPLVTSRHSLFQYVPFPLVLHDNSSCFPLLPSPHHRYIAVDHSTQHYFSLTEEDLSRCVSVSRTHFCAHLVSFTSPTCISQLYFGHLDDISSHCPLKHFQPKVAVYLQSPSALLVSLHQETLSYSVACPNGTLQSGRLHAGHQLVHLDPECSLSSELFSLASLSVSSLVVSLRLSQVSMTTSFLPLSLPDLPRLLHSVSVLRQHSRDLHDYISLHPSHPSVFDLTLLGLLLTAALAVVSYFLYLYHQAKKSPSAS